MLVVIPPTFAFLSVAVSAFGVACLATFFLARSGGWLQILDHPNERSLHSEPTPRTGGLAIWAGGIAGTTVALALLHMRPELAWIAVAVFVVGVVAFIDDRFKVPVVMRLAAHLAAAGLLLAGGLGLHAISLPGVDVTLPAPVGIFLSMLFMVWMTNLYNFMDGMDGFAAGMTVIGFGTFALLGGLANEPLFAALNIIVAAATAGFLIFNFPPARIFMGDTGSSTIGFLAAAFSSWAVRDDIFPLWIGILIFSPFIVDATITLVRRLLHHDRIWQAHKTHYYQRLVQRGWGHKRTTLAEYALMALCSISALIGVYLPPVLQWVLMVIWIAGYAGLCVWVKKLEGRAPHACTT